MSPEKFIRLADSARAVGNAEFKCKIYVLSIELFRS